MPTNNPDGRLLAVAQRQLWLVTRRQALAAGLSTDQVKRRVRTGALVREYAGVYGWPAATPTVECRALAACLACGDGAVASHTTAVAVHGLLEPTDGRVHVTVPAGRRPRRDGIVVHRTTGVRPHERARRGPVSVSSVPRALVEVAGLLTPDDLERVVDAALRRDNTSPDRVLGYLADPRLASSRGVGTLRELVADRSANGVPESELERVTLLLLREFRLPPPARQVRYTAPGGGVIRVDFVYPEHRLVVEVEGKGPHWGRERWVADHDRYNTLEVRGFDALRFTWWHVTEQCGYVAAMIAAKLGLRPTGWSSALRP